MKVIYSTEKGMYLDSKAAHVFFAPGNDFFGVSNYEGLFSKLDNDPNLFGVVPIDDSFLGENAFVLEKLLSGKYKIFGELFLSPHFQLVSKSESKISTIKKVYIEPAYKEMCKKWIEKNSDKEIVVVDDLEAILNQEGEELSVAYVVTESQAKSKKIKLIEKNIGGHIAGALRYFIVGRTFFDMPPEKSDKVIVIFRTHSSKDLDLIESILSRKGLSIFKLISITTEGKEEVEYYAEFGFYGLLDLQELEIHSVYINILGIIESGELYTI